MQPIKEIIMKRLLIVVVLLVAGLAVLGFTRGWFTVASATVEDQSKVTVTVDKAKMQQDKQTGAAKAHELTQQAKDEAAAILKK
jgi:hypothetical protein